MPSPRLGLFSVLFLIAPMAFAATLSVTTTDDVVADDGACSLREALTAANTNLPSADCGAGEPLPTLDEIELPVGIYTLNRILPGDDGNTIGDLDVMESVVIRGLGDPFVGWDDPETPGSETLDVFNAPLDWTTILDRQPQPATVIENGYGDPMVIGDGDRVIHVDPAGLGGVDVTLENITIRGGDLGCASESCDFGAAGVWNQGSGTVSLIRAAVVENQISCAGESCGQSFPNTHSAGAAAFAATAGGGFVVDGAVVARNSAECASLSCRIGSILLLEAAGAGPAQIVGDLTVTESLIGRNSQMCDGRAVRCRVDEGYGHYSGALSLSQLVFAENEMSCTSPGCTTDEMIELKPATDQAPGQPSLHWMDVDLSNNVIHGAGDYDASNQVRVDTDELVDTSGFETEVLERVRAIGNSLTCDSESCDVDELFDMSGPSTWTDVDISDNTLACTGPSCLIRGSIIFRSGASPNTSARLTLLRNRQSCAGDGCISDTTLEVNGTEATLSSLEARENVNQCEGANCSAGATVLIRPTSKFSLEMSSLADNSTTCAGLGCFVGRPQEDSVPPIPAAGFSLGGALSVASFEPAILVLRGTTITGHTSNGNGAGLSIEPGVLAQLSGTQITHNQTDGSGGGIFNQGTLSRGDAVITGNLPAGSDCVDFGDGVGCDSLFIDGFESGDTSAWTSTMP